MTPPLQTLLYQRKENELRKFKTLLENERYERSELEDEVKACKQKEESLINEKKSLKQKFNKLRTKQINRNFTFFNIHMKLKKKKNLHETWKKKKLLFTKSSQINAMEAKWPKLPTLEIFWQNFRSLSHHFR